MFRAVEAPRALKCTYAAVPTIATLVVMYNPIANSTTTHLCPSTSANPIPSQTQRMKPLPYLTIPSVSLSGACGTTRQTSLQRSQDVTALRTVPPYSVHTEPTDNLRNRDWRYAKMPSFDHLRCFVSPKPHSSASANAYPSSWLHVS